jgi:hypothetical protein
VILYAETTLALVIAALGAEPMPSAVATVSATCPVCGANVDVYVVHQADAVSVDRDLFARAHGPQPEFYRVSTCPHCFYSGYASDFLAPQPLDPTIAERIRNDPGLPRPTRSHGPTTSEMIHPLDRYELAIRCYEWAQRRDEALAWLHLRTAWVIRDLASVEPTDERFLRVATFARRWRTGRNLTDDPADDDLRVAALAAADLADGRFNRYQRPHVRWYIAWLLRRHGEDITAEPILRSLVEDAALDDVGRSAAAKMADSIQNERLHLQKAFGYFEKAVLSDQIAPANRMVATYLLGELARRLDRPTVARRWFARVDPTQLPPRLRDWSTEQQAQLAGPAR